MLRACNVPEYCGSGQTCCNGLCLNTQSDPNNCGQCNHVCPGDQCNAGVCNSGSCGSSPAPVNTPCENPDLCLSGGFCNGSGVCTGGSAVFCQPTNQCYTAACDASNGICVQTPSTGLSCENTEACITGGTCTDCPDPANGSPTCTDGVCGIQCESGFSPCGNACVLAGTCCTTCTEGEVCCADVCTNTQTDANHCGGCDTICDPDEFCCQDDCDNLVCTRLILSGSPDPNTPIYVDDDLRIDLIQNGDSDTIFEDTNEHLDQWDPIEFTANPGDELRVRAYDEGASQVISPLYLHCANSPCFLPQHLTDGYRDDSGEAEPGEFFDETFTINVQRAP